MLFEEKNTKLYTIKKRGEKQFTGYKGLCPHKVRGYCRQCIASLQEETETVINTIDETIRAEKTDNLPTIDRAVNPNIEPKYLSMWQADYFRVNLKGNKPYHNIDWYSETVKFRALRLSAYYSVKRYCINYGTRFDFYLFEDCFQDSIAEYMQRAEKVKKSDNNWLLKGELNKLCRKYYGRQRRWLNNNSLEQLLDEAEQIRAGETMDTTEINYRIAYADKGLLDAEFKTACKRVFTKRERDIITLRLENYTIAETSKELKIGKRTAERALSRIKTAIEAGVLYSAM